MARPGKGSHRGGARTRYERRAISYAGSFENPVRQWFVRIVEWLTGKLIILRMVQKFERQRRATGQAFWDQALFAQGISVTTPDDQIAHIPQTGPCVLVANHPHGLVDGMVLAHMIGRRRSDYRILSRSILTGLDEEAARYMISVPFPDQDDAQSEMIAMRRAAMLHLKQGGLVALFPSGVVAASDGLFSPAVEADWNVFTAKLIRLSGATVVPCYFAGANSRAYLMANRLSPLLRQSLLLHEVARLRNTEISPVIGPAIPFAELEKRLQNPRGMMAWLRARTLSLGQRVGTGASPR